MGSSEFDRDQRLYVSVSIMEPDKNPSPTACRDSHHVRDIVSPRGAARSSREHEL